MRTRVRRLASPLKGVGACFIAGAFVAAMAATPVVAKPVSASAVAAPTSTGQRLDHVFVIVEENHGFSDVIGNPAAPNLNALAQQFGIATDYFGVSHPSEPNYVALLGGSFFGINSDNAYWTNRVRAPSLISQLDQAGISWKAYLQALPHPGYQGICYPAKCNGAPDSDPLYVSKHDGIQNFTTSLNPLDWSRQLPVEQLSADLRTGNMPAFNYVVPDECHDMHGDPPYCLDSGNPGDPQDQHLVTVGDQYLGRLVSTITNAPVWAKGNNAIAIVYDEGDNNSGCCDASPGGGQVATVVVTSHGPRGLRDPNPYNHYSLLSTIQHNFGLGCLQHTCDTARVQPMSPLFAVTGSQAIATKLLPVPSYATPTPTPKEPMSMTKTAPSSGGWTVQRTARLGSSDNSVGAIAASSPTDIWAVGNFLPDTSGSNQDATLTLAEHYNGTTWSVAPTPNTGPNFNSFYGVAASQGKAWAVGVRLDSIYHDRALIESWDGTRWTIAHNPQPGSVRDILFGASAISASNVWAVGDQEGPNGRFETLAEHWNGSHWAVVPSSDPGSTGNHLYAVDAVSSDNVWAVGQQLGDLAPDQALIEHWDGRRWSVVPSPAQMSGLALLDGVTAAHGDVWAVGEADSPQGGGRPLVERYQGGKWTIVAIPSSAGSSWTDLWGLAAAGSAVWAVGSYLDPATGNNNSLVLRGGPSGWTVDGAPNPGKGSNILGGVTGIGHEAWAAGIYDNGGSELPFVEHH